MLGYQNEASQGAIITGRAARVSDGNTNTVLEASIRLKVRLMGLNFPQGSADIYPEIQVNIQLGNVAVSYLIGKYPLMLFKQKFRC